MANKRLLELAKRQRNANLPEERVYRSKTRTKSTNPQDMEVTFLTGEFGNELLARYQELIKGRYNNNPILNEFTFEDGIVKGSSPFMAIPMNEILREYGMHIPTPKEIDQIIQREILDLKGKYEDMALVLRNEIDPNKYLAKNLAKQVKQREDLEFPLMIPLVGLELVVDKKAPSGLAFGLTDQSEIIYVPQLNHKNNSKKFSESDESGLPKFDDAGDKTLYTNDSGLVVLIRDGDLGLVAGDGYLAYSDSGGRVIAVRGEATTRSKSLG